jgi:hypothetical protein
MILHLDLFGSSCVCQVFNLSGWQTNCWLSIIFQGIIPPPIIDINHEVDFLSSRSPSQSASQYLTSYLDYSVPNHNLNCTIPCKYLKMHSTTIQCSMLILTLCWHITLIGYVKFGHVHNTIYIKDPTTCWYNILIVSSFPFIFYFFNFIFKSNGILMALHLPCKTYLNVFY